MFGKIVAASAGFVGGVVACVYATVKLADALTTPEIKKEVETFCWGFAETAGYRIVEEAQKPGRAPVLRWRPTTYAHYNLSTLGRTRRYTTRPNLPKSDLTFATAGDAQKVLDEIRATVYNDGYITVNDVANLIGSNITRTFENDLWGWSDMSQAVILDKTLLLPDPINLRDKEN